VSGNRPAQTPVARRTDEFDRRLLETLAAHQGPGGIYPTVPRLARLLGVHVSTVQRSLRRLEAAALVERTDVFEDENDLEWKRRDHRISHRGRQTASSYRLVGRGELLPAPGSSAFQEPAAQTPVAADSLLPLEGKEPADSGYQGSRDKGERPPEPIEVSVEPPESALLDRDPGVSEVLGTLGRAFGDLQVLEGPATYLTARRRLIDLATCPADDLHQAVDQLERHTCKGAPCRDGEPCRRHARRRRT
jgi:DNA-binding Lrp family transcriptional regulator